MTTMITNYRGVRIELEPYYSRAGSSLWRATLVEDDYFECLEPTEFSFHALQNAQCHIDRIQDSNDPYLRIMTKNN